MCKYQLSSPLLDSDRGMTREPLLPTVDVANRIDALNHRTNRSILGRSAATSTSGNQPKGDVCQLADRRREYMPLTLNSS